MSGFAGFVDRNRRLTDPSATLQAMSRAVAHRGPDGEGAFEESRFGLGLAHRRLATLDRSAAAAQPMHSPAGRWVLAFAGEAWNHRDLRMALQAAGTSFTSTGEAQVVAALLDAHGAAGTARRLDGIFAFAALDLHDRALWLVRDRLGAKPCYWGHAEDGLGPGVFVFGSEQRALQACPTFRNRVSPFALAGVLASACVPGNRAIWQGVHKLRPGYALRLDILTGRVDEERWFNARAAAQDARTTPFRGTRDEAVRVLDGLIDAAVRRRLVADVPVGAFLSGGVDSTLVVAAMQHAGVRNVPTFTVGFDDPRVDELQHAREVARFFGTDHHEAVVQDAELPSLAEDAVACFDEPFADPGALATMVASRLARRTVGVVLAGDGGDDLFGGYDRHLRGFQAARVLESVPGLLRRTVAAGLARLPAERWSLLRHQAGVLLRAEGREEVWRGFYTVWPDPAALIVQLPSDTWRATVTRDIRAMERALPQDQEGFEDELLLRDQTISLPDSVLVRLDRASMESGIQAREPLLDQRLFEFAWQIPPEWRTRGGVGKPLLRQVLMRHAPAHIAQRRKVAFTAPILAWATGPLRGWVEDIMDSRRMGQQGVLDPAPVRAAWERCQHGDEAAAAQVWAACVLCRWCEREHVDGTRVSRP